MRPVYILGSPSQNLVVIPPNSSTFCDCRKTWHVPCAMDVLRAMDVIRAMGQNSQTTTSTFDSQVILSCSLKLREIRMPVQYIFSREVWQNAKSLTPLETVSFVSPRTQCFLQNSLIPLEPVNQRLKSLGFHDYHKQINSFVTLTLVVSSSCLCL